MTDENVFKSAITCRLMQPSDIDDVTLLFIRRFQMSRRESSDDEIKRGSGFARERSLIQKRLGSRDRGVAVACLNGAVVGFILFKVSSDSGSDALELEWLARDSRLEKAGVASTLIGWLIDFVKIEFREQPIHSVYLMVNLMHEAAIRLYCRLGFQMTARRFSDLDDEMLGCMELAI
jgi:ribosomal protein S18 acetylase RimI-like enzyme